jgi:hypothetical protein
LPSACRASPSTMSGRAMARAARQRVANVESSWVATRSGIDIDELLSVARTRSWQCQVVLHAHRRSTRSTARRACGDRSGCMPTALGRHPRHRSGFCAAAQYRYRDPLRPPRR